MVKKKITAILLLLLITLASAPMAGAKAESETANWLFGKSLIEAGEYIIINDAATGTTISIDKEGKITDFRPMLSDMTYGEKHVYGVVDYQYIVRAKPDGSARRVLFKDTYVFDLYYMNGYIYYANLAEGTADHLGKSEIRRLNLQSGQVDTIYSVTNQAIIGLWVAGGRIYAACSEEYDMEGHAVDRIISMGSGGSSNPYVLDMKEALPGEEFVQFNVYKNVAYITTYARQGLRVYTSDASLRKLTLIPDWTFRNGASALYKDMFFYADTDKNILGADLAFKMIGQSKETVLVGSFITESANYTLCGFAGDEVIYYSFESDENYESWQYIYYATDINTGKNRLLATLDF